MQEKVGLFSHFFCFRLFLCLYFFIKSMKLNMEVKTKRTAREIKIGDELLSNKNINVKIGTVENREAPETIYIFISFWAKPVGELENESQDYLKDILNVELSGLYKKDLKCILRDSKYFTNEKNNIYLKNIPENINYNNKRNFISLELYLHTLNIHEESKLPLSNKKNTEIFDEAIKIANIIGESSILSDKTKFDIFSKSM